MDGAHDMGGAAGFGPVMPEIGEPVFHGEWEKRAFAITVAMARPGGWNIDMSRFARENRPADDYLSKSYFQIWIAGLETLMTERGLVTRDEVVAGKVLQPPKLDLTVLKADAVAPMLSRGAPTERAETSPVKFKIGERVRARDMTKPTHTRLPRYVRGQVGVIERIHGCHVYPDTHATGAGEQPHWLYTVRFEGRDLWGPQSDPMLSVSVDAWEPYLAAVTP